MAKTAAGLDIPKAVAAQVRLTECIEDLLTAHAEYLGHDVDAVADPRDFDLTEPLEAANAWLRYVRYVDKRRSLPRPLITGRPLAAATEQLLQTSAILDVVDALTAWRQQEYHRHLLERARGRFRGLAARRVEAYSTWRSYRLTWSGRLRPKTERELAIEWSSPNQGRGPARDPRRPFRRSWATTPEWR